MVINLISSYYYCLNLGYGYDFKEKMLHFDTVSVNCIHPNRNNNCEINIVNRSLRLVNQ